MSNHLRVRLAEGESSSQTIWPGVSPQHVGPSFCVGWILVDLPNHKADNWQTQKLCWGKGAMKNIGITRFAERQIGITQSSSLGGFTGQAAELLNVLGSYPEDEMKQGFAPFVRVLEVHPEHLGMFLGTFREAHEGETITLRLEARRPGELPVQVSYLIGEKEAPSAARIILYSREQLAAEGEAEGLDNHVEWAVVSINMGPADEPMAPATMWRNYWASRCPDDPRAKGGSPHWKGKPDEEFVLELARAEAYWAIRGRVVRELPPLG